VRNNPEAFVQAVRGPRAYPVAQAEMLAHVAALQAVVQPVQRRELVAVAAA
jgi:hypothetical protein